MRTTWWWLAILSRVMWTIAAPSPEEDNAESMSLQDAIEKAESKEMAAAKEIHLRVVRQIFDGFRLENTLKDGISTLENVDEMLRTTLPNLDRFQCIERLMCSVMTSAEESDVGQQVSSIVQEAFDPTFQQGVIQDPQTVSQELQGLLSQGQGSSQDILSQLQGLLSPGQGSSPSSQGLVSQLQGLLSPGQGSSPSSQGLVSQLQGLLSQGQGSSQSASLQDLLSQFLQSSPPQNSAFQQGFPPPNPGFQQQAFGPPDPAFQQGFPQPNPAFQQGFAPPNPAFQQGFPPQNPAFQQGFLPPDPAFQQGILQQPSFQSPNFAPPPPPPFPFQNAFPAFRENPDTHATHRRTNSAPRPVRRRRPSRRPQRNGFFDFLGRLGLGKRKKRSLVNDFFSAFTGKRIATLFDQMMTQYSFYPYTHAAVMGYTGSARGCETLYPSCPSTPEEMIDVFNNIHRHYPEGIPYKESLPWPLNILLP